MPKRTVPEPETKAYTDEQLRRIAYKHKALHGTLPYPDPVPVPKLTKRGPNTFDLLWANRWNMARHFIIGGSGAALATFTATKDITASGAAFLVGGVTGVVRKGFDDLRRVGGKPDGLTTVKNLVTRTEGDGMAIRDEVNQFQVEFQRLVLLFFDDTAEKDQIMDIAGAAWSSYQEANDLKTLSKDDMAKAIIDVLLVTTTKVKGEFLVYSDEVTI